MNKRYLIITTLGIIRNYKNWIVFFRDYLRPIKKGIMTCFLRNGIKYKFRSGTSDKGIINEVWIHKIYIPKHLDIRKTDVVLDIGAHIGVFSVFASKFVKTGKIFSFEPVPENFEMLKKNIAINRIKNIVPINKAVSDKKGQEIIFLNENNPGGHSFFNFDKNSTQRKIYTQTISLDSFIKANKIHQIDFLKMDCEGAEYKILFGCSKHTLKLIKKISMENHNISNKYNVDALSCFLKKNGFIVEIRKDIWNMLYAWR